jgi:hypothetical protein
MAQLFTNNASTLISGALTTVSTSIVLTTGKGALFPAPTGGDYFLATLIGYTAQSETSWEIVKCTARAIDTLTVVRAQEGTAAFAWPSNTLIELRMTAATAASTLTVASTSTTGQLTFTDWNTFNGKQAALGFTPYNATNPSGYITAAGAPVQSVGAYTGAVTNAQISAAATAGYGFTPYSNANPSGYITSAGSCASATNAGTATNWGAYGAVPTAGSVPGPNGIPRADASGYTFFNYINSSTANNENPAVSQVIVTNGTDGYYRKANIAQVAAYLSGQTMNINGSSTSCSGNAATASDNVKFMSTSHNGTYWAVMNWDGTYWNQTTNHGSAVRVGYADNSGYAASAGSAPASDVYAWAKAAAKPTYSYSEVGAQVAGSYAPATSGSSILAGNGAGGHTNVTVGTGLTFSAGTLSASAGGSGLGVGQTWTNVTASRAGSGTYTNSTGKPIMVRITYNSNGATGTFGCYFVVGASAPNTATVQYGPSAGYCASDVIVVPDGATYRIEFQQATLSSWWELR